MIPYILSGGALVFSIATMAITVRGLKTIVNSMDKIENKESRAITNLKQKMDALELAFKTKATEPKTKEEITTQLINEWLNGPQEEEE